MPKTNTTLTAEKITTAQIRALRDEAGAAGDLEQVAMCDVAMASHGDLVTCESAEGWSIHAPGATDEAIREGEAAPLATGDGRPTAADYATVIDDAREACSDAINAGQG